MKYWIIGFTPETYEIVKKHNTIGVRPDVWKRFSETISIGDRFIGYISRTVMFDSFGTIASKASFEEDMIFDETKFYPGRRQVTFEKTELRIPAKVLFNGILPFNEINTAPGNYIMLRGGFVEISKTDYDWLISEFKKQKKQ